MDALIVADTTKMQFAISDVLNRVKIDCTVCSNAAEARRAALVRPFDIFIINGGLSDEQGNELAAFLADSFDCGGIYIDDYVKVDMFSDDLGECGVVSLIRPITKSTLAETVRIVTVANARVRALKEQNEKLNAKLDDLKYISRAKIALMHSLGYSEEQAHKFIEKKSMDMRMSRRKVAMDILKTYEA
ncbi:MAG: ANTAR domain-containing protein [Clostridiales bacterium]|nr:ANTAR domain-containing protein [Clostridiales bacterium]